MGGEKSKDPMRESTMSFFKDAFTKPSETMSNFYINQRNQDEVEQDSSLTGSILRSRRSGKKLTIKPSDPPKLRGV